ncbi:hypothetical protein COT75_01085 [Candidatus Beckwithbacteria bacterium CG10_big_fil_rev_8_21_14_0_10_34_10]|uniref:Sortase n=1 Tax=Candidatus Beckwithbacteria bacterium CG10_big_fil_rev_8_21_14_0_10_34_10 TaxID=1974495 RepID=A0A2H0WA38_9BACT|nr:MAG: hypothetical protein COT75_01085 [Candidatus Beckwithbacteria bacterium CG10_big_fil_rev_8_21_14_0_10_34_10]
MTAYSYLKIPPGKGKFFIKKKVFFFKLRKSSSRIFGLTGVALISLVLYYLFSYQYLVIKKARDKILAPIDELRVAEAKDVISPLVAGVFTQKEAEVIPRGTGEEVDYDLINNWFPSVPTPSVEPGRITHYTLTIPKVKIKDAVVEIGGTKVKKNLVHYPGTALPGDLGNMVIFGHSVLPVFYNPKDYKTIFSLIPTLENGDIIYIYYDGIEFQYQVFDYKEVKPEEINILEQRFDQQTLSLITCVPPGTYLKRGIVKARLVGY